MTALARNRLALRLRRRRYLVQALEYLLEVRRARDDDSRMYYLELAGNYRGYARAVLAEIAQMEGS